MGCPGPSPECPSDVPFRGQHLLSISPWLCIAGLFLGPCGSKIKAKELGDLKERVPSIVV